MFRPLRLLLCLLSIAVVAARADIKENFETAEADKPVAGQNGWKDGLHGGHPSCMVVAVEENGKSDKVLQSPAGGDFHVYRCFSAETLKPILDGRLITMSFRYKGNASLGIGITSQLKCDGITTTCGNGISVTAGKTAVSGIALLDPSQWNRVILIMAKEKDEILLTVGIESPQAAGEYNVVAGLGKVKLPFKADALEKWTGVYLRLDSGSMFDDLEISAYDNINSFPFKLKPSSLATMIKFKPVLDHLLPPRQAIDLSGLWEAAPAAMNSRTSPDTGWQPVLVPDVHSSLFKGKAPVVWFRRNFELKEKNPDQRYFLCFERVTDSCEVLVNGKAAGGSDDGFFPFRIDVTGALRPGSNQILVRVAGLSANGGPSIRPSGFSWLLGGFQGIPYPVHLESAGKIGIDDVFVIPRLQPESSLETRVTVTNRGDRTENFTLEAAAGTEFSHRPVAMALNPGESREVVLRDNWKQPELWWPHHPHLYYLDLKIKSGDKEIDAFRQRFGFREIQVKGPDIMLNGTRFIHRRNSIIPYWNLSGEETQKKEIALERERGYNGYRLHGGPSLRIVRTADELGWLVAPEAALCRPLANDVAPAFWPNAEKHIAGMVKALRNNPSIIYWCLSNEFASYFMKGTPEEKAVVDARMIAFGRMAEKLDPVHPWTCSGDGELGGWGRHGPAPTLSFHYPSEPFKQHFTIPAAVYWLEDGPNSWHGIKWDRTKPLIFSEDLFMPYGIRPPGGMARWAGDQAYDMNKGYYQGWFDCIRMYAEGYYHAKLAGWNPWATAPNSEKNPLYNLGQPMPDYLLATREQNVTFLAGEKVKRTLFAYNEMFESMNCKLSAELYSGSQICDSVEKQFKLDGGAMAQFDLTLPMPAVKEKTSLQWRLILTGNGRELTRRTYDYIVYPRQEHFKAPSGCALLSKETQILADIDFPKGRFSDLNAALKSGAGNLVVAQWQCSLEQDRKKLDAAVRNGLNVLWLEPAPGERLPLRQNPKGYEAFGFIRAPLDPAMKNLTDRDLALWRPSGYPVIAPFFKPAEGMFDILADAGTALQYAPLIRFYSGKGYYLLCSFPVISGYGKEPAAAYLAQQLIAAVDKTPQRGLHKLSIGEAGQATKDFFNKFGIPYSEGKPGKVYWAEGGRLSDAVIESIRACCSNGGTVIVDAVDPAATAKLMQLTGGKIVVNKANATSLLKKRKRFSAAVGNQQ